MKRLASLALENLLRSSVVRVGLVLTLGVLIGYGAPQVRRVLGGAWWLVPLFLVGLALWPLVARQPTRWLFSILVLALPFSARLRFGAQVLHPGGAESAIAPVDFPLLALFVLYLLEDLRRGRLIFYNGRVERRLLLFAAVGLLSLVNAADPSFVLYEVVRVFRMIALVYCVKRFVQGRAEVRLVIYLLAFNVVTQSIMGLAQLVLGHPLGLFVLGEADAVWLDTSVEGAVSRVGGTLGHANSLAMFLEMLLPLFFSVAVARHTGLSRRSRLVAISVFALGLAALVLTFSRSSWLSVFVALALVLLYHFRHLRVTKAQAGILFSAGVSWVVGMAVFWDSIYRRLTASSSDSFGFRANLNAVAIKMVTAHPLLGVGLNNFLSAFDEYNFIGLARHRFSPAHNIYFLTAAETGVVGLLVFLWLLLGVFTAGWPALKSRDRFLASCSAGLFAGLAAALIHSSLGWLWRYDVVHVLFWFVAGFALAIRGVTASTSVPGLPGGVRTAASVHGREGQPV